MNIDWMTLIFEMVNFGVLVLIMLRFVFRPVAKILDRRKAELAEHRREIEAREAAASEVRERFEAELADIETLAEQRVNAALAEARGEAEVIIAQARTTASEELDSARLELVAARRRTLERFRGEILRLGTDVARRLVSELGAPEVELGFARRAAHALEDALHGRPPGPVEVRHSADADADAIAALLREELGPEIELHLEADPELVGGVRLHAEGREIEASVGASLDAWYRSRREDEGLAVGA